MYDGGKITAGLVVFVLLMTFPFYFNVGKATVKPEPKIDTPVIKEMAAKKCVESKDYMKSTHMQLLNDWRDWALRQSKRTYVGADGKSYEISLQNTCMKCHSNKKKFCDECHNYTAVNPYCWKCHLEPKEKES